MRRFDDPIAQRTTLNPYPYTYIREHHHTYFFPHMKHGNKPSVVCSKHIYTNPIAPTSSPLHSIPCLPHFFIYYICTHFPIIYVHTFLHTPTDSLFEVMRAPLRPFSRVLPAIRNTYHTLHYLINTHLQIGGGLVAVLLGTLHVFCVVLCRKQMRRCRRVVVYL